MWRPTGHDRRYAVDASKVRSLGWAPRADPRRGPGRPPSTGTGTTAGGGSRSRRGRDPAREDPDHWGWRSARDHLSALDRAGRPPQVIAAGHDRLDVGDRDAFLGRADRLRPDLVVHAAAWTAVDDCEADPDRAWRVNALGSRHVAEAARAAERAPGRRVDRLRLRRHVARPVHRVGRDQIPIPYTAARKLAGEREVEGRLPGATVVRTSWMCGLHGANMVKTVLRLAARRRAAAFRGRPARLPDVHGGSGRHDPPARRGPAPGALPRDQPRARPRGIEFARDVLATAGSIPARGADRHLGAVPRRRARRPARPIRCSTTPPCGSAASAAPPDYTNRSERTGQGARRPTPRPDRGCLDARTTPLSPDGRRHRRRLRRADHRRLPVPPRAPGHRGRCRRGQGRAHAPGRVADPGDRLATSRRGTAERTACRLPPTSSEAPSQADFVFLCVPTPQGADGAADLSFVEQAAAQIGRSPQAGRRGGQQVDSPGRVRRRGDGRPGPAGHGRGVEPGVPAGRHTPSTTACIRTGS